MFRSFIYLDQDALARYSSQLGMSTGLRVRAVDGAFGASVGTLNASVSVSAESPATDSNSIRLYGEFEKRLAEHEGDDYFDFLEGKNYDSSTLPLMCLIRFAGSAMVPEGFDLLETLQKIMPLIGDTDSIVFGQNDAKGRIAMKMLGQNQVAIPIVIDGLEEPVVSKLKTEWIEGGDSMVLEEIEDYEAIFVCRVVAHAQGGNIAVFDPLKDFMKLNRATRRSIERSEGLEIVYENGPVIRAEVVAIYH